MSRVEAHAIATGDESGDCRADEPWATGLSTAPPDRTEPLGDCVRNALLFYLHSMDGHEITNLHRFVLDEVERPLLRTVIEHTNGNQTTAARMLGISRGTLRKKLEKHGGN